MEREKKVPPHAQCPPTKPILHHHPTLLLVVLSGPIRQIEGDGTNTQYIVCLWYTQKNNTVYQYIHMDLLYTCIKQTVSDSREMEQILPTYIVCLWYAQKNNTVYRYIVHIQVHGFTVSFKYYLSICILAYKMSHYNIVSFVSSGNSR